MSDPSEYRYQLAEAIWYASRGDEGTISATGANHVADILLASPVLAQMLADVWDEGWEAAWSPMSMHNRDDGPNPYR